MHRGEHRFPFEFQLPESTLPCSFESKIGTIRYYLRVLIDIPYASPPQGLKYFTIIGPHIDCMDERYLVSFTEITSPNICGCSKIIHWLIYLFNCLISAFTPPNLYTKTEHFTITLLEVVVLIQCLTMILGGWKYCCCLPEYKN